MPIRLTELLDRVSPLVEGRVKRVRDQTRSILQEALRTECRLAMRTPEDAEEHRAGAQVPVEVLPGYPVILEKVTFSDDYQRIMLLGKFRPALEQASTGTAG
jgi:hypothetical protein